MSKRQIERLRAALGRGLSYRQIERKLGKTLGITPGNGTAALRMARRIPDQTGLAR